MFLAITGPWLVILSIIAFILIIGIIIIVHEAGHLFWAKRAGILCHEFSIGMGPIIYKKQFKETLFCIRAIPIGGYVAMAGEEVTDDLVKVGDEIGVNLEGDEVVDIILDEKREAQVRGKVISRDLVGKDQNELYITLEEGTSSVFYKVRSNAKYVFEHNKTLQIEPYERTFDAKSKWKRFITLLGGSLNNFILAILIYLIVSFASGVANTASTKIGSVASDDSIKYPSTGILYAGDEIKSVNGVAVSTWDDFSKQAQLVYDANNTTLSLEVIRNNETKNVQIEAYTYLVSIGLSNIGSSDYKYTTKTVNGKTYSGLEVGQVGIRYIDKSNGNLITTGDLLTKISITYHKDETDKTNLIDKELTSWGELMAIFRDIKNPAKIQFSYYHLENGDYKYVDRSAVIENYTKEVLDNQRIESIQNKIGISPTTRFDFIACTGNAFKSFWSDFTLIFRTLKLLIAPSGVRQVGVQNLSSVVGIFDMVKSNIGAGFLPLLAFAAMICVNIGVVNLLPIPALDGGRIVFLAVEAVTKKKPSKKVEAAINNVFFILILALFVFITINDILRIANR